jgi:putative hydrolase of the HAD superfamily
MTADPPAEWDAVFFDIGGVIISLPSLRSGYVDYVEQFAADHGLDPERAVEDWRARLGEHFRSGEGTEYMSAEDGYRKAFGSLVDRDLDDGEWLPGFRETIRAATEPEPGAVETIRALDEAGLYLGIVSDIDTAEAHGMLGRYGIEGAFDGITTSQDVGYKKPDRRMFADALSKAETVDPGRALMVGDRYEHDMQGGTEAGLWTVAYNGTAAEAVADAPRDGHRVEDEYVDFAVADLRELREIVGIE